MPQRGHRFGRTASTDGNRRSQNLTSTVATTTRESLHLFCNCRWSTTGMGATTPAPSPSLLGRRRVGAQSSAATLALASSRLELLGDGHPPIASRIALKQSARDQPREDHVGCALTTPGPSTHAVDIDENDALHRVAHELAARIEGLRSEALEHALELTMRSTDIGDSQRATEQPHPPTKRAPPAHRLVADSAKRAHLPSDSSGARPLPPPAERPRNGSRTVAQAPRNAPRHHRDHCPATLTEEAAHGNLSDLRPLAGTRRPELDSPPNAQHRRSPDTGSDRQRPLTETVSPRT